MAVYKGKRGKSSINIIFFLILVDLCTAFLIYFNDLYVLLSLIRVFLVLVNIYGVYYFLLSISVKYIVDDKNLYISGIWGLKKIKISFDDIQAYKISREKMHGVKLYGMGNNNFAFGKYAIDKIGTTHMFVTCRKNLIYLRTESINYAISPEEMERFTETLEERKVPLLEWEGVSKRKVSLHKEKSFMIPFIIVSIIILIFTITPLILYLKELIPAEMPLSFNEKFEPVKMGSGKQFAFKQMFYGVLNMAILFCMYYAAHFYAKYDRKSANIYIYSSLIISVVFFLMQMKTIFQFII